MIKLEIVVKSLLFNTIKKTHLRTIKEIEKKPRYTV